MLVDIIQACYITMSYVSTKLQQLYKRAYPSRQIPGSALAKRATPSAAFVSARKCGGDKLVYTSRVARVLPIPQY